MDSSSSLSASSCPTSPHCIAAGRRSSTGDCRTGKSDVSTSSGVEAASVRIATSPTRWLTAPTVQLVVIVSAWMSNSIVGGSVSGSGSPCIFEGHLRTDRSWFGYLANVTVVTTARMTFEFTYTADRCCPTILFYTDEQTSIINARMNCWQKEYLLRPEDDQMLRLTPRFAWSGIFTCTRSLVCIAVS